MTDKTEEKVVAAPAKKDSDPIEVPVSAHKGALIGDEAVQGAARGVVATRNVEPVKAQVTGPAAEPVEQVHVHETHVQLDHVITDAASPEAVQIPDAGRGSLDLPIRGTGVLAEDVFKKASEDAKKS